MDDGGVDQAALRTSPLPRRRSSRYRRLANALETYRALLESRAPQGDRDGIAREARKECIDLLEKAEEAYRGKNLGGAWSLLLEAQRSEIGVLSESQRRARALALLVEAGEKLSGWRQKAVLRLLADDVGVDQLKEATQLRNEHFHNLYHKLDLGREHLMIVSGILVAALTLLLAVVGVGLQQVGKLRWLDLLALMILGAVGGALSAVRSFSGRPERRIPDQLAGWPVTALRPLIGAAAALGVALMLQAGAVSFGGVTNPEIALFAIAFLAGFSERWFLGMIGTIPGGASERE